MRTFFGQSIVHSFAQVAFLVPSAMYRIRRVGNDTCGKEGGGEEVPFLSSFKIFIGLFVYSILAMKFFWMICKKVLHILLLFQLKNWIQYCSRYLMGLPNRPFYNWCIHSRCRPGVDAIPHHWKWDTIVSCDEIEGYQRNEPCKNHNNT